MGSRPGFPHGELPNTSSQGVVVRRTPQRLILVPHSKSKEVANKALPCVEAPIGVFDSGVGGLSVLREIRAELPKEDLIYVNGCPSRAIRRSVTSFHTPASSLHREKHP